MQNVIAFWLKINKNNLIFGVLSFVYNLFVVSLLVYLFIVISIIVYLLFRAKEMLIDGVRVRPWIGRRFKCDLITVAISFAQ